MADTTEIVYKNTNIKIILDTEIDLTGGSNPKIHYRKPDGETGSWTGTISGKNILYTTSPTDLDQDGEWEFQAVVNIGTNLVKGRIVKARVYEPITTN